MHVEQSTVWAADDTIAAFILCEYKYRKKSTNTRGKWAARWQFQSSAQKKNMCHFDKACKWSRETRQNDELCNKKHKKQDREGPGKEMWPPWQIQKIKVAIKVHQNPPDRLFAIKGTARQDKQSEPIGRSPAISIFRDGERGPHKWQRQITHGGSTYTAKKNRATPMGRSSGTIDTVNSMKT